VVKDGGSETFTITFSSGMASQDIPQMTITPTGFTPTSTTAAYSPHGGPIGQVCRDATITPSTDIQLSKNSATAAFAAGSVVNAGAGLYFYEFTAAEVNTLGVNAATVTKAGLYTTFFRVDIEDATTPQGFYTFTAASGTTNSVELPGSASSNNDTYKDTLVVVTSGPGSEEGAKYAWAYNGTTKELSTEPAYITPPDSTSVIELRHISPCLFELLRANHLIENTIGGEVATTTEVADQVEAQIIDGGTPIVVGENGGVTLEPRRGTA
jgi:hypothetical protein